MTTNTLTTDNRSVESVERVQYSRLWWAGLLAIVLSTVANLAVRAFALPFITVSPEFTPISTPQPTIFFTVFGVLAAVIAFAIVGRFARRPARTYTIVAVVALLLSLIPDLMMLGDPASAPFPGANVGSVLVLMVQHVVAAVITVYLLITRSVETQAAK